MQCNGTATPTGTQPENPKSKPQPERKPFQQPPHSQTRPFEVPPEDPDNPDQETGTDDEMVETAKIKAPEEFKGDRNYARGWFQEMESFFRTPESKMNNATTRSKIVWTMNNMTGDTKEWKYDRNRVWYSPAPTRNANRSYVTLRYI